MAGVGGKRGVGVGIAMSSIGGLNFPGHSVGGGLWWPLVTRGYSSRGLIGGADTPGKGGMGGLGVHSHTNPECRFTVGEELVMGGGTRGTNT